MGGAVYGAGLFFIAIENGPTGCDPEDVFEAGQREAMLVDQGFDAPDLFDVRLRIAPVVGIGFAVGLDQPLLFIFTDSLLGQSYLLGHVIDQIGAVVISICSHFVQSVI